VLGVTGKAVENDSVPGTSAAADTAVGDALNTTSDVNVTYFTVGTDELVKKLYLPLEVGYYRTDAANGAAASDNQTLIIYDARAKLGLLRNALMLGLEIAMNGGKDNNNGSTGGRSKYKGNAVVTGAEYNNADLGFGVKGFIANASGQNQNSTAWSSDKSFHDGGFLGGPGSDFRFGEIMSNSNTFAVSHVGGGAGLDTGNGAGGVRGGVGVNIVGLGGSYTPKFENGRLTFTLDLYTAKALKVPNGADKKIGNEVDLAVKYRHSEAITASVGYAMFSPGTGIASGFVPNPVNVQTEKATKLWAKLALKWGGDREDEMVAAVPAPAPMRAPAARPAPRRR
jgi:hypothetical protein